MATMLNPCSYLPRRLQVVASLTIFVLFCILFLGTSETEEYDPYLKKVPFVGPRLQSGTHQAVQGAHQIVDNLPKIPNSDDIPLVGSLNPFKAPTHKPPPEQSNSTSGDAKWYSDWQWRNPFSSSVTFDEERAVLPPFIDRPVIYTYFDSENRRKDEVSKKAEQELLQIWRRAWWAKGFKPVVLGPGEAKSHALYPSVQKLKLNTDMHSEMMRWMAWSRMGAGILCNWLAVPMASHDDPMLTFLRRNEFPTLTRYSGLGNALFVGGKDDVERAVKAVAQSLDSPGAKEDANKDIHNMADAIPKDVVKFASDPEHDAIAFYGAETINAKYSQIKEKLAHNETVSEGLAMLPPLINSHLHLVWQSSFTSGIAVLKPLPEHTTSMVANAIEIARDLAQCSNSSLPSSCPPNRQPCTPCVSTQLMSISTPSNFKNTSTLFTIGTVPHPYTLNSLVHSREDLTVAFIRRQTARDSWITSTTKDLLGSKLPSSACLVSIKDAVASPFGIARSLWVTAERLPSGEYEQDMQELDWIFGFKVPRRSKDGSKADNSNSWRPKAPETTFGEGPVLSSEELAREKDLLEKARGVLRRSETMGNKDAKHTRNYVEAWNLADTEAWKFVRAYNARRKVERHGWSKEEEAFQGKGALDRWMDNFT